MAHAWAHGGGPLVRRWSGEAWAAPLDCCRRATRLRRPVPPPCANLTPAAPTDPPVRQTAVSVRHIGGALDDCDVRSLCEAPQPRGAAGAACDAADDDHALRCLCRGRRHDFIARISPAGGWKRADGRRNTGRSRRAADLVFSCEWEWFKRTCQPVKLHGSIRCQASRRRARCVVGVVSPGGARSGSDREPKSSLLQPLRCSTPKIYSSGAQPPRRCVPRRGLWDAVPVDWRQQTGARRRCLLPVGGAPADVWWRARKRARRNT
jgi:hypothetical protein